MRDWLPLRYRLRRASQEDRRRHALSMGDLNDEYEALLYTLEHVRQVKRHLVAASDAVPLGYLPGDLNMVRRLRKELERVDQTERATSGAR